MSDHILTPKERSERVIRKVYRIPENELIPDSLKELQIAIAQELWEFLADNATPITPPTKGNAA